MSQANLQCEWDCPCVGSSTARTTRIIEGLFVIQILCLISAFFLLFASVALIYGVHTWSRHLIWPWFICIVSSILTSLAYCIMWWAGDVRDYWMALTILEIIGVFINVYCVVVVYMFMQRLAATTDEYEGKKPQVRYKVNRNGYTRKPLDDYRVYEPVQRRLSEEFVKRPFPHYTTPVQQPYPMYSPSGMPQTPLPMPSSPYPAVPPYPVDDHERVRYDREPKARFPEKEEDPVAHWVKDQQKIALLSERGEAISEPISLSRPVRQDFPLQHSRSVPSLYDGGTLVSHRSCRHGKHRSSSKRRRRSRHANNSSDSESPIESTHDHRRRRRSRTRCSESEFTDATERWDRAEKCRRSRRSHSDHHNRDRDDRRRRKEKNGDDHCRRRHERDGYERNGRDEVIERISERRPRERRHEHKNGEVSKIDRPEKETSFDTVPTDSTFPLAGGISIPQHIVIPPSMGERGPDGLPLPQKFQINSEITINYDGMNPPPQSDANEPYRRRYPAVGVQSNV